jgi:hypothetical protein
MVIKKEKKNYDECIRAEKAGWTGFSTSTMTLPILQR